MTILVLALELWLWCTLYNVPVIFSLFRISRRFTDECKYAHLRILPLLVQQIIVTFQAWDGFPFLKAPKLRIIRHSTKIFTHLLYFVTRYFFLASAHCDVCLEMPAKPSRKILFSRRGKFVGFSIMTLHLESNESHPTKSVHVQTTGKTFQTFLTFDLF